LRLIAVLLILSACGRAVAPPGPLASAYQPPPMPLADTCGAGPHAGLIGQPATALERTLIMRQVRLLRGTEAAVPASVPGRINFVITPTPVGGEQIAAITCG
jgi:hypothetical protein